MISGISGRLHARETDRIAVATSTGITYDVFVPLGVLERLPAEGATVTLETVLVVREDSLTLYGFDRGRDRAIFQRLLGATGVGPRLALALLSALGGDRVVRALREGDTGILSTVPGVGRKTAEKLVVELKDRMKDLAASESESRGPGAQAEQAMQALMNLGYAPAEAERAVRAAAAQGGGDAGDLIRRALQNMIRK